jgi:hypothetical protein
MDKERVVHVHNGVLFMYKKWSNVICRKGRTEHHHIKPSNTQKVNSMCVLSYVESRKKKDEEVEGELLGRKKEISRGERESGMAG